MSGNYQWRPLSLAEVVFIFKEAGFRWWIAGGYAIEHAVGRPIREHSDIDVLILRDDQLRAQELLAGWDCWAADPPGALRPWGNGEFLFSQVSDIWCRKIRTGPWQLQLMLDESYGEQWFSRRDRRVTKAIEEIGVEGEEGAPFLAADIQLFYKAKAPRPKDELDFAAVLPCLTPSQRSWLRNAIVTAYGLNNPWLKQLEQ